MKENKIWPYIKKTWWHMWGKYKVIYYKKRYKTSILILVRRDKIKIWQYIKKDMMTHVGVNKRWFEWGKQKVHFARDNGNLVVK